MNFLIVILLLPFVAFGKSTLDLSLNNNTQFRSKSELLQPLAREVTVGNQKAKVRVTIFDSYSCIHCARFYREIFPQLEEEYIKTGKVYFIHKEFPLDKHALFATKVVHCSGNKLATVKNIYQKQEILLEEKGYEEAIIKMTGVSKSCIQNLKDDDITKQAFEYSKVLGIKGTPTVFVNSDKVENFSKRNFFKAIDESLVK